ncbi:MAG: YopX family protein [Butyrivibrio sp.]|nr:YopX family protein [Butyrivibrio sp.]
MREILFRGRRVDNGEWTEGYYFKAWSLYVGADYTHFIFNCDRRETYAVVPASVCQYMGLTDRNGRKIFEGDICKRITLPLRLEYLFEIRYVPEKCCFLAVDLDGTNMKFISDYFNSYYDIEVVGNIFDNRELLKEEAAE